MDNESSGEGVLFLILVGAVVLAVAGGKAKSVEEGGPEIVDVEEGAGTGKY